MGVRSYLLKKFPSDILVILLFLLLIGNLLFDPINKEVERALRPFVKISIQSRPKESQVLDISTNKTSITMKDLLDRYTSEASVRKGTEIKGFIVSSPFGKRISPTTGASIDHKGIDLATPIGTAMFIPTQPSDLIWTKSSSTSGLGGLTCRISTSIKNETLTIGITHASKCSKEKDIIGLTGNTGTATTGPHAHISVALERNGKRTLLIPSKELLEQLVR